MKKNLALPEGVAEIPIEALDLSTRPYNCLKRARINTVGQLQEMTEEKLLRLRNLGLRSMEEIQSKLKEYKAKKS
jgi:DNA-directed RNA polymerase subunit alpha